MFNDVEQAVKVLADLERESSFTWRLAGRLATNVEKDRTRLIVPVVVVDPVSLLERALVLKVGVIDLLSEGVHPKILDNELIVDLGRSNTHERKSYSSSESLLHYNFNNVYKISCLLN